MAHSDGWIKLHRKLLTDPLFLDTPAGWLKVAITILLMANHEPRNWYNGESKVPIPAGSFVTSSLKLSKICHLGRRVIRNAMLYLEKSGFATIETTNRYMFVSITNWDSYQMQRPTGDQVKDQRATNERPTNDQRATTTKECKKERSKERTRTLGETSSPDVDAPPFDTPDEERAEAWDLTPSTGETNGKRDWKAATFDEFWASAWLKKGKGDAKGKWLKLVKDESRARWLILKAQEQGPLILADAVHRARDGEKPRPLWPGNWLSGERYDDDWSQLEDTKYDF